MNTERSSRPPLLRSFVEACVLVVVMSLVALIFNHVRVVGLELVAQEPHQVLVPCPEPGGPVEPVAPNDPAFVEEWNFFVDARSRAEYEAAHYSGAVNVPFDWLDPVPEEELVRLAERVAASRARRVVVYGDGGNPDSGEHLGKEISGRGIKNVFFVSGGAPALIGSESR